MTTLRDPAGGAEGRADPLSVQVQTVLYDTDLDALERFIAGVSTASSRARAAGVVGRAVLTIGDSSAEARDGALALLERVAAPAFDELSYVHFGANLGSAGGHNRLFGLSGSDLVLVINPDAYASPRLLCELVGGLEEDVGVVEARQLPLEHPKAHDPHTGDVSWASGACFLVRSAVIKTTGGFDPEVFFMYCDDVDFSWRARLAGWRVVHRPQARVFHDKRLNPDGLIEISAAEARWSAEASVLLAWRYGQPERALEALDSFESSDDPDQRAVAERLRALIRDGQMPDPLPGADRVAQFVDGEYAEHRFSYREP
jgi:hypothetical protein